jgi:energy-coupling factor transporter ATP-binding protein EcfA2
MNQKNYERDSTLRLYTSAQWRKCQPPKPTHYVEGLILSDSVVFVHGEPGSGKSTLIHDLAVAIAHGETWFGRQCSTGRVAFLIYEGANTLQRRLDAASAARGHGPCQDEFVMVPTPPPLTNEKDLRMLKRQLAALDVKVVVVDTFTAACAGMDIHGGSSTDPTLAMRGLRSLCPAGGVVLVVHHPAKGGGTSMSGSAVMERDMDTELQVSRPKQKKVGTVTVKKQRSLPDYYDLGNYEMVPVADEDGDSTITVRGTFPEVQQDLAWRVQQYLTQHPDASANAVHKALGGRKKDVLDCIRRLRQGVPTAS